MVLVQRDCRQPTASSGSNRCRTGSSGCSAFIKGNIFPSLSPLLHDFVICGLKCRVSSRRKKKQPGL